MSHALSQTVALPIEKARVDSDWAAHSATFARARTLDEVLDGHYLMSNGSSLEVAPFGDAIRVSFGPGATLVLRPDGQGSFVSRDGQIALRYERERGGRPGRVSVSAPASVGL